MTAFSDLILKYGYRGTTTKKIADRAGVNESTIFRHFKDKNGILTMLVADYLQDVDRTAAAFKMVGDIELDLVKCARLYQNFTVKHQSVFLLGLHESYQFPEVADAVEQLPKRFKKILITKFTDAVKDGEINSKIDIEAEASNFIVMTFGNAVLSVVYPDAGLHIPNDIFLERNVRLFAAHLK